MLDPVAGRLAPLSTTGSGALLSTLVERGRVDVDVPGEVVPFTVDDGSVPGLVLTASGDGAGTRPPASSAGGPTSSASVNAVVLDGRVYVSTRAGAVVL